MRLSVELGLLLTGVDAFASPANAWHRRIFTQTRQQASVAPPVEQVEARVPITRLCEDADVIKPVLDKKSYRVIEFENGAHASYLSAL